MKRKHSKFEPEPSKANDIIGLGFDSDSDSNQLREHEPYPDNMGPDSESKPFIELFSMHDDRFDLQGSRGYGHGHIPEAIETDDDELLESQGANIRTETYYPEGGRTVVREEDREWVE